MRHDNFIPVPRYVQIQARGYLPHWQVDEAVYFVTFRLRDSLPREVAFQLREERELLLRKARPVERAQLDRAFALRLDRHLDAGGGACLLRAHGELVAGALKHFDRARYELHAWCVMPNHVHVLLYLANGRALPSIIHSWKSYTAHVIGRGPIWQKEYFDRVIRSPQEYADTKAYILRNPEKAGLRDWLWVG